MLKFDGDPEPTRDRSTRGNFTMLQRYGAGRIPTVDEVYETIGRGTAGTVFQIMRGDPYCGAAYSETRSPMFARANIVDRRIVEAARLRAKMGARLKEYPRAGAGRAAWMKRAAAFRAAEAAEAAAKADRARRLEAAAVLEAEAARVERIRYETAASWDRSRILVFRVRGGLG